MLDRGSSGDGQPIVMVTHDSRMAAYADRIVFLKDGRVVDEERIRPTVC
jgi:putative ABC transport system ATP-binding protein